MSLKDYMIITNKARNITSIVTAVVLVIIISIMVYVIMIQRSMLDTIDQTTKEQKFLKDNITRIESTILTPDDFNKRLNSLNLDVNVIRDDLKKVNGKIDQILISESKTPGGKGSGLPSTSTTPNPNPGSSNDECKDCYVDQYGYFRNVQEFKLSEPVTEKVSIPFGSVQFNAAEQKPWSYNIYPRTYLSTVVLATDSAGNKRAYGKISITPQDGTNKRYDLPEMNLQYVEKYPESQFFWWNPRAMVGFDLGIADNVKFSAIPSAQLFISSYGRTSIRPDWHIGGIGVGYNIPTESYSVIITPFAYKITGDKSIFQNINVGPSVGIDTHAHVHGLIGLRFGL